MSVGTAQALAENGAARRHGPYTDGEYGTVAKWFHWITLLLLAVTLPKGFVLEYIAREQMATKLLLLTVHMSAGLTILAVTIARLAWRIADPPPPLPDHVPAPLRFAAGTVHWLLYAALLAQPVLGFAMANAMGYTMEGETAFLWVIDLPAVIGENDALAETLTQLHTSVGYALVALIAVHVCGAVYHHAIRRDGTLLRML